MTPTQLYEYELRKAGVKDAADIPEGSDETSFEEEMAKFKDMPKPARDREIAAIKKELLASRENKTGEFLNKLSERAAKTQTAQAEEAKVYTTAKQNAVSYGKSLIGQTVFGAKVTPEMVQSIENIILKDGLLDKNPDGTLNEKQLFELAYLKKFALDTDLIWDAIENYSAAEMEKEILDKVEVSGTQAKTSRVPQTVTKTDEEIKRQIAQSLQPVAGQFGYPSVAGQR